MRLSQQGYSALVAAEGMRLEAYPDPASGGDPWTIGIGCTTYRNGSPVKPGDVLTYGEAHSLATWHIEQIEAQLEPLITVPVDSHQWDALVSLVFNIGIGAFKGSTLLKKLNAGDTRGAAREFDRWVYAAGKVMQGLVNRRAHERAMFEGSLPTAAPIREAVEFKPASLKDIVTGKEPEPMPAPFVVAAFNALLSSVPTLIRHFGKGERSEENAKIADVVVPIAKQAIDAANEQDLVEKLADPEVVATVDRAVRSHWAEIVEAGGGGIEGAREANLKAAESPLWRQPAIVMAILVLPLIYMVVYAVMFGIGFSDETRVMVVSLVVGGALGGMVAFFWGSSMSSRTKDEALVRSIK